MKPVDTKRRIGAVAMAISITFSIVWAMASYAYERPSESAVSQAAAKHAPLKACS